jgi:apolipoprotein N-acyltransferase
VRPGSRAAAPLLARTEAGRLALAGILTALVFPPLPFGPLAFLSLTPLLAILDDDPRPGFRRGFTRGAFFGAVFYALLLAWLWDLVRFTPLILPTWALSSLYLGGLVGLAAGAAQWLRARTGRSAALLLPVPWLALEKLLQYGDLRFTWGVLADAIAPFPVLIQTAELWGAPGLSLLIVAVNGLVFTLWRRRRDPAARRAPVIGLAALAAAVPAYGGWRLARDEAAPPGQKVRIAVVQPDVPQEVRDDPRRDDVEKERLFALSRRALASDPDLVVWPETAAPWLRYDPGYVSDLQELCCTGPAPGTPFLVGGLDAEDPGGAGERIYNAAFTLSGAGQLAAVYRKVLLVPMTEQVPYAALLGWLKPEAWSGRFRAGEAFHTLRFDARPPGWQGAVEIGVPICYEIIFPQAIRGFRNAGARLIVTITNDAWFGRTPAPYQHFSQLALRAVENRVPIARAANTGISGFVSPSGRTLQESPIFVPGVLVADLALAGPPTPYARWGDWIVPASAAGLALALVAGSRRRRRHGRTRTEGGE